MRGRADAFATGSAGAMIFLEKPEMRFYGQGAASSFPVRSGMA